jgi:hypothetical protein
MRFDCGNALPGLLGRIHQNVGVHAHVQETGHQPVRVTAVFEIDPLAIALHTHAPLKEVKHSKNKYYL